jgi:phage-related protein
MDKIRLSGSKVAAPEAIDRFLGRPPSLGHCKNAIIWLMAWVVELLDDRVREELEALPPDMQARFRRLVELIQGYGLERVHEPHIKHLEGPLWEMRMKGRDGISRAVYVTAKGRRVVVVRVFVKKTQKTPRREIEIALERAQEVQDQ